VNDPEVKAGPGAVIDDLQTALAKGALGEPLTAQQRLAELVSPDAVDRMLADAESAGVSIDGPDGLLGQLTRTVLERALGAELDDHLGYVKGDPAGNGSGTPATGLTARRSRPRPGRCGSPCRGTGIPRSSRSSSRRDGGGSARSMT
jgi:hypothetical protein